MKLPVGIELSDKNSEPYCLELRKNLYGQRNTGRTFFLYIVDGLIKLGYRNHPSTIVCFTEGQPYFTRMSTMAFF